MNYAKDYKNDSPYVSVNTLIRPQKSRSLSVVPPAAEIQTKEQERENGGLLPENPATEGLATGTDLANIQEEAATGQTADQPAALAANTQTQETQAPEAGTPEAVTPEAGSQDAPAQETTTLETEPQDTSTVDLAAEPLLQQDDKEPEEEKERKSDKGPNAIQRKSIAAAASGVDDAEESSVNTSTLNTLSSSGEPLPEGLRRNMGGAMGADFENVRIHRDQQSAALAGQLSARAFTHREDVYFNQGQYNPDTAGGRHLIAHELAHVEQQRTVPGLQYRLEVPAERDRYEQEADVVADKAVNSPASIHPSREQHTPSVTKSSSNSIQLAKDESGSNLILDKVGGLLKNIPGYDILVLIIGRDPVSGREVKRDGIAFVKAIVGLIPGGRLLFENLEKAGIISRAVAWFKDEFQKLNISFNTIKNMFSQTVEVIFGKPKSGGGFFSKLGKAIFNAVKALLSPKETFEKIKHIFLGPIKRIMNFLGAAGPKLMEFIFEGALTLVGAPVKTIMGILNKGKEVLGKIIKDPIGFLKNLLNAVKGGLSNFVGNIITHLQNGIGGWLFGALGKAGIVLPEKLNLAGVFQVAAQVLGVTWQAIKTLVAKKLGPIADKVMGAIEKSVGFVVTLVTKGPMALLEMAQEFLGELKTLFFDTMIEWVRNTIVVKAIQKLITMFNPVGAIIQAVITIYNTIQFFIERAKQIAAFVGAVFNSIAEIAGGNIGKAVAAVENALAKGVPVAISFLANLIGLGGIAKKVQEIIKKVRKPIDKVIGKVVGFIVDKGKKIWSKMESAGKKVVKGVKDKIGEVIEWWKTRKVFKTEDGEEHSIYFEGKDENSQLMIASKRMRYAEFIKGLKPKDKHQEKLQMEALGIGQTIDNLKIEVVKLHRQYKDPQKDMDKKQRADEIQDNILRKMTEMSMKITPFFENEIQKERYLPKDYNVRVNLYLKASGYSTLSKKMREDKARELNLKLEDIKTKSPNIRKVEMMKLRKFENLIPIDVDDELVLKKRISPSELNVDHIIPLAKHWVEEGYNGSDEIRNYEANKASNFNVIHESFNKSKGSEDEEGIRYFYKQQRFVGPKFSSMSNNSPLGTSKISNLKFSDKPE